MGSAGMAAERDECIQAMSPQRLDDIDKERLESGGRNRDCTGMAGGRATIAVVDRRCNEQRPSFRSFNAHLVCLEGVGGERKMGAMLFHRTERDQNDPGAGEAGLKLRHCHVRNDHNAPKSLCIWGMTRTSGRRPEASS